MRWRHYPLSPWGQCLGVAGARPRERLATAAAEAISKCAESRGEQSWLDLDGGEDDGAVGGAPQAWGGMWS